MAARQDQGVSGGRRAAWRECWVPAAVAVLAAVCLVSARCAPALRVVRVAGGPRDRGLSHGRELASEIRSLCRLAAAYSGRSPEELRASALEFEPFVSPDHLAEMRGIADGARVQYGDVLMLNCWYELETRGFACRQLVVVGGASADGRLIHGRNLDWADYGGRLRRNLVLLDCDLGEGERLALFVWPGMVGSLTGTNRHGVTVALNQLGVRKRVGEPVFLLIRRALENAADLAGAVAALEAAPVTAEAAIVVSDGEAGEAACIEWFGGECPSYGPEEGILAADNSAHAEGNGSPQSSTVLWQLARAQAGALTPEGVQQILRHPRVLLSCNLYSCVFVPASGVAHVAAGRVPAARGSYAEVALFPDR